MRPARIRILLFDILLLLFFLPAAYAQLSPTAYTSLGTLNITSGTLTINTDTLAMTGAATFTGVATSQTNGPQIAVFDFSSINIGSGVTVNITGSRHIAFLSRGNATIGATLPNVVSGGYLGAVIDVSGSVVASQPGQGPGAGGASGPLTGGGGYGGTGGGATGATGVAYGNLLQSLTGGSGGGAGVSNASGAAQLEGGNGGGAVEIVAAGNLSVANVSASGGGVFSSVLTSASSGVSGGAGGGILLSGGTGITVTGSVSAIGSSGVIVGSGTAGGGGGGQIVLNGIASYTLGAAVAGITTNLSGGNGGTSTTFGEAGMLTVDAQTTTIPSGISITLSGNPITSVAGSITQAAATIEAYVNHNAVINTGATVTLGMNNALQQLDSSGNNITEVTNNGTLNLNGYNQTIDTLLGTSTSATLNVASGSTLTVGIDNSVAGSGASSFSGQLTGSGALVKLGTGSLTLGAANSFSGATTVSGGTLTLANNQAQQNSTVTLSGGGLGFSTISAPVLGALAGASNQALSGISSLTVGGNNSSTTYSGNLSGSVSGGLDKVGTGTWTVSGTNTQSGPLNVQGGTLLAGSTGAISPNAAVTVSSGATLDMNGYNYTVTSANPINVQGTLRLGGASLNVATGANATYNGGMISNGVLQGGGTQTLTGGATLSGVTTASSMTISQTGAASASNFTNNGQFNNAAGQNLNWSDGTVTSAGKLTIGGTVTASDFVSNGILTINGGGTLNNSGSSMVLGGGSQTTINTSGVLSTASGTTIELNGGLLTNNGTISGITDVNYGSLAQGTGTYGMVNVSEGGVYSPGDSPGIVTAAAVNFGSDSGNNDAQLQIQLGGTTPGTQYDQLHVTGQLALGGILQVSLMNGFSPGLGNTFDILKWGTLAGHFGSLSLPALSSGLSWNTTQLYTSGALSVIDTGFLPGDFNRDNQLDAGDILAMEQALANPQTYESTHGNLSDAQLLLLGDVNGDGKFTGADLQALLNIIQSGSAAASPVPEPAALALGLLALGGLWLTARWPKHCISGSPG